MHIFFWEKYTLYLFCQRGLAGVFRVGEPGGGWSVSPVVLFPHPIFGVWKFFLAFVQYPMLRPAGRAGLVVSYQWRFGRGPMVDGGLCCR